MYTQNFAPRSLRARFNFLPFFIFPHFFRNRLFAHAPLSAVPPSTPTPAPASDSNVASESSPPPPSPGPPTPQEVAGHAPTHLDELYPALARTLICVSKMHRVLEPPTFQARRFSASRPACLELSVSYCMLMRLLRVHKLIVRTYACMRSVFFLQLAKLAQAYALFKVDKFDDG